MLDVVSAVLRLLPGVFWFFLGLMTLLIIAGGLRYTTSGGDSGNISEAKNDILYGVLGAVGLSLPIVITEVLIRPTRGEVVRGMGLGALLGAVVWLALATRFVPRAVAAYSSWWMPQAEKAAVRQDILYALSQARRGTRSRHAWSQLKSSPRAGLRARRHQTRLAAAVGAGSQQRLLGRGPRHSS